MHGQNLFGADRLGADRRAERAAGLPDHAACGTTRTKGFAAARST